MDFKASAVSDSSHDDFTRGCVCLKPVRIVMHTQGRGERGGWENTVNDLQIYSLSRQVSHSGNVLFLIGEQL